ncbi:hypothetical protein B0H14DRAFT_2866476 [Mycena olivaceomarginata]|nr:hypothetical protein B0H14DRAFT_2866476 [Mycena olivaceomarginata]
MTRALNGARSITPITRQIPPAKPESRPPLKTNRSLLPLRTRRPLNLLPKTSGRLTTRTIKQMVHRLAPTPAPLKTNRLLLPLRTRRPLSLHPKTSGRSTTRTIKRTARRPAPIPAPLRTNHKRVLLFEHTPASSIPIPLRVDKSSVVMKKRSMAMALGGADTLAAANLVHHRAAQLVSRIVEGEWYYLWLAQTQRRGVDERPEPQL